MSTAPSWLTEENINTAATAAKNPQVQAAAKAAATTPPPPPKGSAPKTPPPKDIESGNNQTESSPEVVINDSELKEMQKYHLALRLGYIGASIMMAAAAALELIGGPDLGSAFFAIYIFMFAVLICCFECALNSVSRVLAINFGFLYSLAGRGVFLLFVGFMCYSLGLYGIIAMALLYVVGLFHIYILYKFPKFSDYLRKKHFVEGKDVEGTGPAN